MNPKTELAYVDHQCFFALYEMQDAQGKLNDPERLAYEQSLLIRRLYAAAEDGVDLYHVFGRSMTEFLTYEDYGIYPKAHPRRQAALQFRQAFLPCLEKAAELGIRIGFSSNQFTFPQAVYDARGPELCGEGSGAAKVCPGLPFVWELYRSMFREFFDVCPGISVLQLTTNETQVNVVDCDCPHCAHLGLADRILKLTTESYAVCAEHGVELQLRSWGEMEDEGFFDHISDALPEEIPVSLKNTQGDFHLYLPMHRMIGYGERSQIVEFDAWREFSGWNGFPCFMGYRYKERIQACQEKGVARFSLRLTWLPNHRLLEEIPWGNDLNRRVFLALLEDPDLDVDLWLNEALQRICGGPCPQLFELYRDSSTLLQDAYFPGGMHLHSHSTVCNPWESGNYALQEIRHWTQPMWKLQQPQEAQFYEIVAKNQKSWHQVVTRVERLKGQIPDKMYSDLLLQARGQRCLLQILPRLALIRCWMEEEPRRSPGGYHPELDQLRDLALRWQAEAPQHFEEKLGAFVLKSVAEARLHLEIRRPESTTSAS